ncbi:cytochrome P450 [Actinomadura hibisca]|uniref:cytochrome P450 n=1 Tax=Actinomadura hibisca TaxID=68565 RepID=UPI000AD2E998|nr:cytochrome P450 [Actinomadura hibisca]
MTGPDILSAEYDADPYPHYETMRTSFPVYVHESTGFYVLSRYRDVVRALQDPPFTNECYTWQIEPVMGDRTLVQMDGREHADNRKMLGGPLRGGDYRDRVVPSVELACAELVDGFRRRGRVELMSEFATWLPINVMASLLGLPAQDRPRFQGWYMAIIAHMVNFGGDPEVEAAGQAARRDMTLFLGPMIEERRARPGQDILSALCTARFAGGPLTDQQIQAHCAALITAGGDTTVSGIANTVKHLLLNPEHLRAVRADRELIDRMHIEAGRLNPPAHLIMRYAAENADLGDHRIPAGSTVACMIGSANRDPARFTAPDTFDPHRPEVDPARDFTPAGSVVTFGRGRHFCLGAALARTTVNVAVNQLLDALPGMRLEADASLRESGIFTRKLVSLPIRFDVATTEPPTERHSA